MLYQKWVLDQDKPNIWKQGGRTITAIAREHGLSVSRVSRLVAKGSKAQVAKDKDCTLLLMGRAGWQLSTDPLAEPN